jgi:hypothetical protein
VTRDAVVGVAAADGAARWEYPLPRPGLTNVPTPLALPGDRLLVSCQGLGGTALLRVTREGGKFSAAEVWRTKGVEFFYCNWARDGDLVYGYGRSRFVGLRWKDGKILWDSTALKEANVLACGGSALVLRGDGLLESGRLTAGGFKVAAGLQLFADRSWTPPAVVGATLYARNGKEVAAVPLGGK